MIKVVRIVKGFPPKADVAIGAYRDIRGIPPERKTSLLIFLSGGAPLNS
jgi:hypothetical protein